MSEAISSELFQHLVHLAQLELTPEEAEYLRRELNRQLDAVRKLEAIPLDPQVPITSHGVPYRLEDRPAWREDRVHPFPHPQRLVQLAPETQDGFVVVPDVHPTPDLT